jgi:hypothetical protein
MSFATHVPLVHRQPCSRAHCSTSRCPPRAPAERRMHTPTNSTGRYATAPTAVPLGARLQRRRDTPRIPLAVVLPRPPQHIQVPAHSDAFPARPPAFQGQSCSRAHCSASQVPSQGNAIARFVGPEPPTVWHAPRAPVHPGPSQPLGGRTKLRSSSQTGTPVGKRGSPEASTAACHGCLTCASMVRSKGSDQPL